MPRADLNVMMIFKYTLDDTRGATAIEYGLIIALIAAGIAAGFGGLSDLILQLFDIIGSNVADAEASVTD